MYIKKSYWMDFYKTAHCRCEECIDQMWHLLPPTIKRYKMDIPNRLVLLKSTKELIKNTRLCFCLCSRRQSTFNAKNHHPYTYTIKNYIRLYFIEKSASTDLKNVCECKKSTSILLFVAKVIKKKLNSGWFVQVPAHFGVKLWSILYFKGKNYKDKEDKNYYSF